MGRNPNKLSSAAFAVESGQSEASDPLVPLPPPPDLTNDSMLKPDPAPASSLRQLLTSPQLSQLVLLLLTLSCCGSLVGLNRLLPRLASDTFHTTSHSLILAFVAIFGLSKASFNLIAAQLASTHSRTSLLVVGWLISLLAPIGLLLATTWSHVLLSTLFFGSAQGILTSCAVIMLNDRVGSRQRGAVNGVLECVIYCSLAVWTMVSGWVDEVWGYRPWICYLSIVVSVVGMAVTALITDTRALVKAEEAKAQDDDDREQRQQLIPTTPSSPSLPPSPTIDVLANGSTSAPLSASSPATDSDPSLSTISSLLRCWRRPHLLALIFAGFCNNFDDGIIWGSLPAFFTESRIPPHLSTVLLSLYPLVWGVLQVGTGVAADKYGRKVLIVGGMCCQSAAFLLMYAVSVGGEWLVPSASLPAGVQWLDWQSSVYVLYVVACVLLGVGTASCYPVLQASLADSVAARQRASTLGVYRLCRDSGYVAGGLLSGVVADVVSLDVMVLCLAGLLASAAVYGQARLTRDSAGGSSKR